MTDEKKIEGLPDAPWTGEEIPPHGVILLNPQTAIDHIATLHRIAEERGEDAARLHAMLEERDVEIKRLEVDTSCMGEKWDSAERRYSKARKALTAERKRREEEERAVVRLSRALAEVVVAVLGEEEASIRADRGDGLLPADDAIKRIHEKWAELANARALGTTQAGELAEAQQQLRTTRATATEQAQEIERLRDEMSTMTNHGVTLRKATATATETAETLRRDLSAMETQLHEVMDAREEAVHELEEMVSTEEGRQQEAERGRIQAEAKLREVEKERDGERERANTNFNHAEFAEIQSNALGERVRALEQLRASCGACGDLADVIRDHPTRGREAYCSGCALTQGEIDSGAEPGRCSVFNYHYFNKPLPCPDHPAAEEPKNRDAETHHAGRPHGTAPDDEDRRASPSVGSRKTSGGCEALIPEEIAEHHKARTEIDTLKAEQAKWIEAVALATTLVPDMVIDVTDPVGMMKKLERTVRHMKAERGRARLGERRAAGNAGRLLHAAVIQAGGELRIPKRTMMVVDEAGFRSEDTHDAIVLTVGPKPGHIHIDGHCGDTTCPKYATQNIKETDGSDGFGRAGDDEIERLTAEKETQLHEAMDAEAILSSEEIRTATCNECDLEKPCRPFSSDVLCLDCVADLAQSAAAAEAKLREYEDETTAAMSPHPDEEHCACAALLRVKLREVEKERDAALRKLEKRTSAHIICRTTSTRRKTVLDALGERVRELEVESASLGLGVAGLLQSLEDGKAIMSKGWVMDQLRDILAPTPPAEEPDHE